MLSAGALGLTIKVYELLCHKPGPKRLGKMKPGNCKLFRLAGIPDPATTIATTLATYLYLRVRDVGLFRFVATLVANDSIFSRNSSLSFAFGQNSRWRSEVTLTF